MKSPFRLEVREHGRAIVLAAGGELDLVSATALERELERVSESGADFVIVDLRELEFLDSSGLSVLVRANQRAQDAGRSFALVAGAPQVQRLLNLTGVADRLTVVDTLEELLGGG